HRGIDLDRIEWYARIAQDICRYGFRVVIFDPIRRYSANADKGPAEVRQITGRQRTIVAETRATITNVHHDTKPPANGKDERRRAQRASGGDWFAASDCPLSFEFVTDSLSAIVPADFKISTDPQPFNFHIESDDPRNPTIARLIAENSSVTET